MVASEETLKYRELAIFFTGGTLAMVYSAEAGGPVPAVDLKEILEPIRGRFEGITLRPVQLDNRPSSMFTPEEMFQWAQTIKRTLHEPSVKGAIVLHGTDTMEESAFLTQIITGGFKPVVFTGSMRRYDDPGYDGFKNLIDAIQICLNTKEDHCCVTVSMGGRFFSACEVTKCDSTGISPYGAPGVGPIGYVVGSDVTFVRVPGKKRSFEISNLDSKVDLIKVCAGMDDRYIRASMDASVSGIVIEAFGCGSIPPSMLKAIGDAIEKGIVVVVTSRCAEGGVYPIYGFLGGGRDVYKRGVIFAGRMTGQRARILLMVALGETRDVRRIRDIFEKP